MLHDGKTLRVTNPAKCPDASYPARNRVRAGHGTLAWGFGPPWPGALGPHVSGLGLWGPLGWLWVGLGVALAWGIGAPWPGALCALGWLWVGPWVALAWGFGAPWGGIGWALGWGVSGLVCIEYASEMLHNA